MGIKFDREKQTWEVSYSKRHPITRQPVQRKRVGLKSMAEAKRVEKELVIILNEKLKAEVTPTWAEAVNASIQARLVEGQSKRTLYDQRTCIEAYTSQWNERLIDTITTQEIRDVIQKKVGHRSQGQQKHVLKCIRAVLNHAVDSGQLARNPTPQMKFRMGDKIMAVLTAPQVKLLLEKAIEYQSEWYPHWAMACYTGMRTGELYALTWDKVDLERRQIKVSTSWNNKDGFKDTKSGDDRIVEIAEPLIPPLQALRLQGYGSAFVLPRLQKWDKGEQARELRMFLMGLGLPPVRFHDLRATWATILLSQGVEALKVMKMGGWKDLKTMQRYIRKAGVDIQGITKNLVLHDPAPRCGEVIPMVGRSDL